MTRGLLPEIAGAWSPSLKGDGDAAAVPPRREGKSQVGPNDFLAGGDFEVTPLELVQ